MVDIREPISVCYAKALQCTVFFTKVFRFIIFSGLKDGDPGMFYSMSNLKNLPLFRKLSLRYSLLTLKSWGNDNVTKVSTMEQSFSEGENVAACLSLPMTLVL